MEGVLLIAERHGALPVQGPAQQKSAGGRHTERHQNTPLSGLQSHRLHQKTACVQTRDSRLGGIPYTDQVKVLLLLCSSSMFVLSEKVSYSKF